MFWRPSVFMLSKPRGMDKAAVLIQWDAGSVCVAGEGAEGGGACTFQVPSFDIEESSCYTRSTGGHDLLFTYPQLEQTPALL